MFRTATYLVLAFFSIGTAAAEPLKVLYVGGGCCHDYETQKTLIKNGLEERVDCEVTVVHDGGSATDAAIPLYDNPMWHDGYDAVIHHECFADVRDPAHIERILAPHRAGLPAVVMHCAVHSYGALRGDAPATREWRRFIGVHSNGHGAHYGHEVFNVRAEHPIMLGFGPAWSNPQGELYRVTKLEPTVISLGAAKDRASGKSQVCVWTNTFDKGRVFGTTLGHHNETVGDAKFLDLVARGLQWSVGRAVDVEWDVVKRKPVRENLALGKTFTASSTQGGNELEFATDGDIDTRWCASNGAVPQWFQVDLGEPQTLTGVQFVWERPSERYRVSIEGSGDGKEFKPLVAKTDQAEVDFDADGIRYVRTTCSKTSGGWVSVREMKVLGTNIVEPPAVVSNAAEAAKLAKVTVPEGFEKTLFAAPPAVNYPVFVAADVDGSVYVSQDQNGSLDREGNRGSVIRLRDLDGDGRADESVRFVENVDSPRGLVFDQDRVYLMHPPHLSAFIDTDHDGVADEQKVLVKNIAFGFEDRPADHTSNGVTLGIDGWLYLAIGDFGFMNAEGTDGRTLQLRGGGVVRVRPDGTGLELYSRGTRNILEAAMSPRLESFARDNTNDGGGWDVRLHHFSGGEDHGYPRKYVNFGDEIVQPLADYGGGSGCGAGWIDEPSWPAEWRDTLYTADWGRGGIFQHALTPSGATFTADQRDFVKVPRATDIDVDAAGNAYISSWDGASFTYVGEDVGFIVRVRPEGGSAPRPVDMTQDDESTLIRDRMTSASHRVRLAAQRKLLSLGVGDAGREELLAYASDQSRDLDVRIAALMTLSQLDGDFRDSFRELFEDDQLAPFVLRAASDSSPQLTRELCESVPITAEPPLLATACWLEGRAGVREDTGTDWAARLGHEDPVVRHTARNALANSGRFDVAIETLVESPDETTSFEASRVLAEIHDPACVDALIRLVNGTESIARRKRLLAFDALARLVHQEGEWTGSSWGTRPDNAGPYYSFARWSESDRIEETLKQAVRTADSAELATMLPSLSRNQVQLDDTLRTVVEAAKTDLAIWPAAAKQLAKSERLPEGAVELLVRIVADQSSEETTLAAAAEALLASTDAGAFPSAMSAMSRLGDAINQPSGRGTLKKLRRLETLERHVDAIVQATERDGGEGAWATFMLLSLRKNQSAAKEPRAIANATYEKLLTSEEGRRRLLDAVNLMPKWKDFNPVVIDLAALSGAAASDAKNLANRRGLKFGASLEGPALKGTPIAELLAKVEQPTGHATDGQVVFAKLSCSKCHSVSPSEPSRGPELSNAARVYKRQQLAEAILDPNKTIAQGFATNLFVMADGRVQSGFVVREADAEVVIRDGEGKEFTLKTAEIEDRVVQKQSLMPAGQVDSLSVAEFAAVLDYLESLGS